MMCKCFDGTVVRKGRAQYVCARCGQDISYPLFLLLEATPDFPVKFQEEVDGQDS